MLLTSSNIYKMSEASIAKAYSIYLQEVFITESDANCDANLEDEMRHFLSYDDFKDYYILSLVGKDNYVDKLVYNIQHSDVVRGV